MFYRIEFLNNEFFTNGPKKVGRTLFVKVYQFHIKSDKIDEYIKIQDQASEIYSKYIEFQSFILKSKAEETKWVEISRYKNEEEYNKAMKMINEYAEIQLLYKNFQSILLDEKQEISEEEFLEVREANTFRSSIHSK
ncbi:hypothetical protein [Neobacillus sp. D3-1R]|uniref:hypothetical protein n=1 Tax=Neobacillus sp. D3-1R TaxID=3445778 RepID=UPI003FA11D22